jgi:hypothetical protein
MKLFGFHITRKPPEPQVRVVEPVRNADVYDTLALSATGLRRGMWVMKDGFPRAGVLTGLTSEGIATVMLTRADGTNLAQYSTLASSLRQAHFGEIPAARVTLSADEFAAMGYKRRPA